YVGHRRALHSFPTRRSSDLAPVDRAAEMRDLEPVLIAVEQIHFLRAGEEAAGLGQLLTRRHDLGDARVIGLIAALAGRLEFAGRSEEHTSELQSRSELVCRL